MKDSRTLILVNSQSQTYPKNQTLASANVRVFWEFWPQLPGDVIETFTDGLHVVCRHFENSSSHSILTSEVFAFGCPPSILPSNSNFVIDGYFLHSNQWNHAFVVRRAWNHQWVVPFMMLLLAKRSRYFRTAFHENSSDVPLSDWYVTFGTCHDIWSLHWRNKCAASNCREPWVFSITR